MKNILIAVLIVALLPAIGFAQDANLMKYVQLVAPTVAASSSNSAVSVAAYKGNATIVMQFAPATEACTNSITIKHSATAGGVYTTVTNLQGTPCLYEQVGPVTTAVQTIAIDMARVHPYIRAYTVQTTQTNAVSALLVAPMKAE